MLVAFIKLNNHDITTDKYYRYGCSFYYLNRQGDPFAGCRYNNYDLPETVLLVAVSKLSLVT